MNMTPKQKRLSLALCLVLVAVTALCMAGCGNKTTPPAPVATAVYADGQTVGEGEIQFTLTIADKDGAETVLTICTDQTTVGEALQELEIIEGEEGPYGLYIRAVNGIVADYDADSTYWAFYVEGEYAMSGVDTTDIVPGGQYALRVEQ